MSSPERPIGRARPARCAALALLALLLAPPAAAQPAARATVARPGARPPSGVGRPTAAVSGPGTIALYPVTGRGEMDGDAADVQSLLDAAIHRVVQRSGDLVARDPMLLRASCGSARSATPACLAQLGGGGIVVRANVHRAANALVVTLQIVDRAGESHGPVAAAIDAYVQSAEPLTNGLLVLVDQVVVAERRRAQEQRIAAARAAAGGARPARPPGAPAAEGKRAETGTPGAAPGQGARPAPAERGDLAARQPPPSSSLVVATQASAPRAWMRPTGRWMTGIGAALLAGGIALSTVNRSASDDLDRRYGAGTLTQGDLSAYRRVDRVNTLTAAVMAAGGAFTLAGIALWTAPPVEGRVVGGVAGRF